MQLAGQPEPVVMTDLEGLEFLLYCPIRTGIHHRGEGRGPGGPGPEPEAQELAGAPGTETD